MLKEMRLRKLGHIQDFAVQGQKLQNAVADTPGLTAEQKTIRILIKIGIVRQGIEGSAHAVAVCNVLKKPLIIQKRGTGQTSMLLIRAALSAKPAGMAGAL